MDYSKWSEAELIDELSSMKATPAQEDAIMKEWLSAQPAKVPDVDIGSAHPSDVKMAVMQSKGYSPAESVLRSQVQDVASVAGAIPTALASPAQAGKAILEKPVAMMERSLIQAPAEAMGYEYNPYFKEAIEREGQAKYEALGSWENFGKSMKTGALSTMLEGADFLGGAASAASKLAKFKKLSTMGDISKGVKVADDIINAIPKGSSWVLKEMSKGAWGGTKALMSDVAQATRTGKAASKAGEFFSGFGVPFTGSEMYKHYKKRLVDFEDIRKKYLPAIKGNAEDMAKNLGILRDNVKAKIHGLIHSKRGGGYISDGKGKPIRSMINAVVDNYRGLVDEMEKDPDMYVTPQIKADLKFLHNLSNRKPGKRTISQTVDRNLEIPVDYPTGPRHGMAPDDMGTMGPHQMPGSAGALPEKGIGGEPMPRFADSSGEMLPTLTNAQKVDLLKRRLDVARPKAMRKRKDIEAYEKQQAMFDVAKEDAQRMYGAILEDEPKGQKNLPGSDPVMDALNNENLTNAQAAQLIRQIFPQDKVIDVEPSKKGYTTKKYQDQIKTTVDPDAYYMLGEVHELRAMFNSGKSNPFNEDPNIKLQNMTEVQKNNLGLYDAVNGIMHKEFDKKGLGDLKSLDKEFQSLTAYAGAMERGGFRIPRHMLNMTDLAVINAVDNGSNWNIQSMVKRAIPAFIMTRMLRSSKFLMGMANGLSKLDPEVRQSIDYSMMEGVDLTPKASLALQMVYDNVAPDIIRAGFTDYLRVASQKSKSKTLKKEVEEMKKNKSRLEAFKSLLDPDAAKKIKKQQTESRYRQVMGR